jgi:pimeloyl-ACP methyl ester carboxylesterase
MRSDGVPEVRYARSGDVSIAYQLVGDSPRDLVFVPTFSNLVYPWWNEDFRTFYERLGAFARLILLDKRGTGLSDRPRDLGTLESRIDDIRAVLDAAGSKTAILLGTGEGGQICTFFAATYPERTQALILYGTPARAVREDDAPVDEFVRGGRPIGFLACCSKYSRSPQRSRTSRTSSRHCSDVGPNG